MVARHRGSIDLGAPAGSIPAGDIWNFRKLEMNRAFSTGDDRGMIFSGVAQAVHEAAPLALNRSSGGKDTAWVFLVLEDAGR
jgi:hypothetical protein